MSSPKNTWGRKLEHPRRKGSNRPFDDEQIFRYWVEILTLSDGTTRSLPLRGIAKIHLARRKSDPQLPTEHALELQDGSETMGAASFDELVAQLREKYPDELYERRLRMERDAAAEERRRDAMRGQMRAIAEAAVRRVLEGDENEATRPRAYKPGARE